VGGLSSIDASATWIDDVPISVPGLPDGAPLLVQAGIRANGSVLGQAYGSEDGPVGFNSYYGSATRYGANSNWTASVRVVGYGTDVTTTANGYCNDGPSGQTCGGTGFGTYGIEFFALNKQLVTVTLEAVAQVDVSAAATNPSNPLTFSANADGLADIGQTTGGAGWSGIPLVTYQGDPVDSFTAIGFYSGVDYTQPLSVPAPAPAAMQATAMLALAACIRLRRAHATPRSR
jgi:hypothetical protein